MQLLDAHYQTLPVGTPLRPVLRRWLFSLASCGMRIPDAQRVARDWRFEDTLIFKPWRGRRRSDRHIKVLLGARAMQLWDEAIAENNHPHYVFTDLSSQKGPVLSRFARPPQPNQSALLQLFTLPALNSWLVTLKKCEAGGYALKSFGADST